MINHGPVVLVTSGGRAKPNIITIAWVMPVSKNPPMLAISVGHRRHSHGLITDHGEFAVCVPPASLLDQVWQCGRVSGAEVDKFEAAGLRPSPSREIDTPGIEECVANRFPRNDRAGCERFYADHGNATAGGRAPLHMDLPECVAAHEHRQGR